MNLYILITYMKTFKIIVYLTYELYKVRSNKMFILGVVTTNTEIKQKYKWLAKYYPNIKYIFYMFYIIKTRSYN